MITDHICGQRPSPLCDGIIRAFKTISAALSSSWCLVIKPLSCSLSSCSVNQGVARHVTVWRIALCNTVISARSPPTQPAAMGPSSQPPAACYYHNPAAWVLSASDLLRHEQLQPAAHNKHSFCSFQQLCGKHRPVKSRELHESSVQHSQQTQTQRRRRFPPRRRAVRSSCTRTHRSFNAARSDGGSELWSDPTEPFRLYSVLCPDTATVRASVWTCDVALDV